jgi:predicted DNA-binding transcriptional regulator AlpA
MKEYLTVKDLSKKLHVCRATIYNYLKKIPDFPQPQKLQRSSRWDPDEMESFMNNAPRGVYGEGTRQRRNAE